jgi:hypothetical protein
VASRIGVEMRCAAGADRLELTVPIAIAEP